MEQENQLQIFNNEEFGQVKVIKDEKGEPLFELYSVGTALGYSRTDIKNGKEYFRIRKDRIDKVVENADIKPFAHGGQTFLNEDMLYDFIFESKTEKSKPFRKWVTSEVLPTLRKTGTYSLSETKENNELVAIGNNLLDQVSNSLNNLENRMDEKFKKLEEKQEDLEYYYKPTHKNKLGMNSFIKSCLGDNATKENCDRATMQLLLLLGNYETYQEVQKDILESVNTKALAYDICKNINLSTLGNIQ